MMEGLPTCANCHSISRDGKTMGIDVDGPQNDKGLYAMIPIKKVSSISNEYVIHWSAFSEERSQKRFGFMSQISPDGKYVVTSIEVPARAGTRVVDRLYNGFYDNYGFGQVFYPTRGVLGWYSKETGKLAAAARRGRSQLRADRGVLEPGWQVPGLLPGTARDPV